jgi:hypothetical protein
MDMRGTTPNAKQTTAMKGRAMTKTAAGMIDVLDSARSEVRGGTTMFFGVMADGRFVVTSRFQYELRTKDRAKAERKFRELCHEGL